MDKQNSECRLPAIKAIMDRVFVRLDKMPQSNVLLPENYEQDRCIGTVESVGEQVRSVKIGDKVLFHVFDELPAPEPDLIVVRERSLLGIFTDN